MAILFIKELPFEGIEIYKITNIQTGEDSTESPDEIKSLIPGLP